MTSVAVLSLTEIIASAASRTVTIVPSGRPPNAWLSGTRVSAVSGSRSSQRRRLRSTWRQHSAATNALKQLPTSSGRSGL
jgi:hypothetical protein